MAFDNENLTNPAAQDKLGVEKYRLNDPTWEGAWK